MTTTRELKIDPSKLPGSNPTDLEKEQAYALDQLLIRLANDKKIAPDNLTKITHIEVYNNNFNNPNNHLLYRADKLYKSAHFPKDPSKPEQPNPNKPASVRHFYAFTTENPNHKGQSIRYVIKLKKSIKQEIGIDPPTFYSVDEYLGGGSFGKVKALATRYILEGNTTKKSRQKIVRKVIRLSYPPEQWRVDEINNEYNLMKMYYDDEKTKHIGNLSHHPNQYHQLYCKNNNYSSLYEFSMPYFGESLEKKFDDVIQNLSFHDRMRLMQNIIIEIDNFHRKTGHAHLDIKEQNIVLQDDLTVKLIDFGLGRRINSNCNNNFQIFGTPLAADATMIGYPNFNVQPHHDFYTLCVLYASIFLGRKLDNIKPFHETLANTRSPYNMQTDFQTKRAATYNFPWLEDELRLSGYPKECATEIIASLKQLVDLDVTNRSNFHATLANLQKIATKSPNFKPVILTDAQKSQRITEIVKEDREREVEKRNAIVSKEAFDKLIAPRIKKLEDDLNNNLVKLKNIPLALSLGKNTPPLTQYEKIRKEIIALKHLDILKELDEAYKTHLTQEVNNLLTKLTSKLKTELENDLIKLQSTVTSIITSENHEKTLAAFIKKSNYEKIREEIMAIKNPNILAGLDASSKENILQKSNDLLAKLTTKLGTVLENDTDVEKLKNTTISITDKINYKKDLGAFIKEYEKILEEIIALKNSKILALFVNQFKTQYEYAKNTLASPEKKIKLPQETFIFNSVFPKADVADIRKAIFADNFILTPKDLLSGQKIIEICKTNLGFQPAITDGKITLTSQQFAIIKDYHLKQINNSLASSLDPLYQSTQLSITTNNIDKRINYVIKLADSVDITKLSDELKARGFRANLMIVNRSLTLTSKQVKQIKQSLLTMKKPEPLSTNAMIYSNLGVTATTAKINTNPSNESSAKKEAEKVEIQPAKQLWLNNINSFNQTLDEMIKTLNRIKELQTCIPPESPPSLKI